VDATTGSSPRQRALVISVLIVGLTAPAVAGLVSVQRAQVAAGPGMQGNGSPYALFGLVVGVIASVIIAFVIESGWRAPRAEPNAILRWAIIIVLSVVTFAVIFATAAHRDPTGPVQYGLRSTHPTVSTVKPAPQNSRARSRIRPTAKNNA